MIAYRITCLINGKVYIGITTRSIKERWRRHCEAAKYGRKTRLAAAIRKYGTQSFAVEHIASARTLDDLNMVERLIIEQEGSFASGYNATLGGEGVSGLSPDAETRWKIGTANRGKKQSPELIRRRADALRGRAGWKPSPEQRQAASEARKGKRRQFSSPESRANFVETLRERVFSPEWKQKISEAKQGIRTLSDEQYIELGNKLRGRKQPPRSPEHSAPQERSQYQPIAVATAIMELTAHSE
jgi:group I intron endonuclease